MTHFRPFLVLLGIGLAMLAAAERSVLFAEGLLPANVLAVRNNSGSELYFFFAQLENSWSRLFLKSGDETELPRPIMVVVPTSPADGVETGSPQKSPDVMRRPLQRPDDYYMEGSYFVRELTGKQRWELCWSYNKKAWVVQMIGENLCR